nr:MAG TPA: protein of unknown function (DUF5478) [Caudoviricetes sp.]
MHSFFHCNYMSIRLYFDFALECRLYFYPLYSLLYKED